jgi:NAD(P)-dependent dehydrogenase (short-subunit alcohol dehydrogenase family)
MRSVLVTGTSSGIGLATVVLLAMRGWGAFATIRDVNKRGLLEEALQRAAQRPVLPQRRRWA